jgi:hypothetical protein
VIAPAPGLGRASGLTPLDLSPSVRGMIRIGVVISAVPVAILFTDLQQHLIRGLAAGALEA